MLFRSNTNIFKKYHFIKSAGLYGSCAKGENTEDSDMDLWIRVEEVGEEKLAPLTIELNKKIKDMKILFLTDTKVEKIKKEDSLFYNALFFGSIILYGEKDGLQI